MWVSCFANNGWLSRFTFKHHKYLNTKGDPGLLKTYVSSKYVIAAMEWAIFCLGMYFLTIIPYRGFKQGNIKDRFLIGLDIFFIFFLFWLLTSTPLFGSSTDG